VSSKALLNVQQVLAVRTLLQDFAGANPGAKLLLLTSEDGFELATYPASDARTSRIAAMSSSIQALSDSLSHEVGQMRSNSLIVESDGGVILVVGVRSVTPRMSLAIFSSGEQLLGKLLWATRELARGIGLELALVNQNSG
jgi:predicted regulator of Ras-like GTPase activity (Roadblock/LC7/MglB family)